MDGLKAVLSRQRSRQGSNVLNRGDARQGRELEAEARQTKFEARQNEIDVVCIVLIPCTMHM